MAWKVELDPAAERELGKIDQQTARRIRDGLNRLAQLDDPTTPCKALSGPLTGLWRYRVGDYRVILDIDRGNVAIVAIDLGHRSEIYG